MRADVNASLGSKGFQSVPMESRFWAKVKKTDGCWPWTGYKTPRGYGYFWRDGRLGPAYRTSYELLHGPIPDGLVLDHLCRNPSCVRPDHLEAVTQAENTRRGMPYRVHGNSKKTHCKAGHPLEGDNLRPDPCGKRKCRECARQGDRRRRAALLRANPSRGEK